VKTGNIMSMAVQISTDGNIYCEFSELPFEEIDNIFKDKYDASLVKTIHKFVNRKFKDTSISLEKEIQAATSTLI
tara:strand:- start:1143 stop:1367 length:225 start_codon:yes stop_codon:yes gene_type:complete